MTRHPPLSPHLPALVREAAAARLDLRALDDEAGRALLRARYALAAPDEARLVAYLRARAEGNPFFAGELLRALEEAGLLLAAGGGARVLGDVAGAGVPPLLRLALEVGGRALGADELLAVLAEQCLGLADQEAILAELPDGGLSPEDLHARLDGTRYAAAAEFADWLWAQTDSVFLDVDEEVVLDVEWTRDSVLELARQWRRAEGLLDRVTELAGWLEGNPAARFARLLEGALGRDAHLEYQRIRRWYAYEITDQGLVPVPRDGLPGADDPDDPDGVAGPQEAEPVPVPPGAAA